MRRHLLGPSQSQHVPHPSTVSLSDSHTPFLCPSLGPDSGVSLCPTRSCWPDSELLLRLRAGVSDPHPHA
eukprot:3048709-Rhodomonas_salina.1